MYDILASTPGAGQLMADRCEIFFSDERSVGPEDADSNYRTAKTHLFEPLNIPERIIHRIHGEASDLKAEAKRYASLIRMTAGVSNNQTPELDLTLLGMGSDGHAASLFPDYDFGNEPDIVVAPFVHDKRTYRISFGLGLINASRAALFLVTGEEKAPAVKKALIESITDNSVPASRVQASRTVWMLDREAAGMLNWTGRVLGL
jgi:6-phosphogluconolactonase